MTTTPFQDDFQTEFRAEQTFLATQVTRFEPLSAQLRHRSIAHFLSAGLLLFFEGLLYAAIAGCVALFFFRNQLYPFFLLSRFARPEYESLIGKGNLTNLSLLIWGLVAVIALLCALLARSVRRIRHKNAALARTGTVVKGFMGELLGRKAALDALEQRHYATLPMTETRSSIGTGVNDVLNPGYDNNE